MKNVTTKFPLQIDDRVFFQDINIDQVPILQRYQTLLSNGQYSTASEYLNNSEVFFYGAWCLNLIENRLFAIGNYVIDLEEINLVINNKNEPSTDNLEDGITWLGGNE